MHGVHWLAENCLTSQTLRFLFIYSAWTVTITVKFVPKRVKKKKKKNRKTQMQMQTPGPNAHLGLVWFKKMVTHHSVFTPITHHLKHPTLFGTITYLSLLNIFQLFVGPIHVPCAAFTLFFFSFNSQYPNSPN